MFKPECPALGFSALPDANFYIFLSNGDDILREMRKFAATLH